MLQLLLVLQLLAVLQLLLVRLLVMLPLLRVVMLLRCSVAASPTTPHCCDNLARRLLKTTSLDVKRYGPPGKINDGHRSGLGAVEQ